MAERMYFQFIKRIPAKRIYFSSHPPSYAIRYFSSTTTESYNYDLIVIGGGSGGLACSKEAAMLGGKVAVLDYVSPSPQGSSWGLGGTCVNVGCIPKKLMHQASLLHSTLKSCESYGWMRTGEEQLVHDWKVLVQNVRNHILSLNWGHRVQLKEKQVDYFNCRGSFMDPHTVQTKDKEGKIKYLTGKNIVLSMGGRPDFPHEVPGAKEYGISSDDLFFLEKPPGKTLVIGGGYVALECAGFINGLGHPTSLMMRSRPLKAFDKDLANLVTGHMEREGVNVLKECTPLKVIKDGEELQVHYRDHYTGEDKTMSVNTVLFATGRKGDTTDMKLDTIGIQMNNSTRQVLVNDNDATNISNIFAIGDIAYGRPQLTPVAIMAGKLLARRLFTHNHTADQQLMNYNMVPTTVFTPLEYGAVGLSEDQALTQYGENNIEIFHAFYKPLEYYLPSIDARHCYIKAIEKRTKGEKPQVIGLHTTGPNAGEMIQGFAVALKHGISMSDIQSTVGIHPTCAEEIVKLHITKSSGVDPTVTAC